MRVCAAFLATSNPIILTFEFVCGLVSMYEDLRVRMWTDVSKKEEKKCIMRYRDAAQLKSLRHAIGLLNCLEYPL